MGTRGLRVYRLKKRYYVLYNHWDSYPDGLGKTIVAEIPSTPSDYQAWLSKQRQTVAEWEAEYERFITIGPGNHLYHPGVSAIIGEENTEGETANQEESDDNEVVSKLPKYMADHFPSFLAPLNNTFIEWIYTLDLDNEIFSVSNGAHFPLEQMPHIQWTSALEKSFTYNIVVKPGVVPEGVIRDLIVAEKGADASDSLESLVANCNLAESITPTRRTVEPKSLGEIPWIIRHGTILRSIWFYVWSTAQQDILAATLLQLTPSDLLFRELSFAILCMAAGGKNVSVLPNRLLSNNSAFGFINYNMEKSYENSEFFSLLGSGAHREDDKPGSAPEQSMYWFENVLVVLRAQLYRKDAVEQSIDHVTKYCLDQYGKTIVDAVLISIEHVVLLHIIPDISGHGAEVQHSRLLPLIDIPEHLTMRATDRYSMSYLSQFADPDEKFQKSQQRRKKKAMLERMQKNEGVSITYGNQDDDEDSDDCEGDPELLRPTMVEGATEDTFYALVHLFSAAARRRLRPNQQGCFPTEIYECILSNVTDWETRDACLHTSHILREICLKEHLFCEAEGLTLRPCEDCQTCTESTQMPRWFNLSDRKTQEENKVAYKMNSGAFPEFNSKEKEWSVMVGNGYGKKSLLAETNFLLNDYTE